LIHKFQSLIQSEDPQNFTDPFRYVPHPLVKAAAEDIMNGIDSDPQLEAIFAEGKMLGVLVCRKESETVYIAAFSGNVGGQSYLEGFVPPICDLTSPGGEFRRREAEITAINAEVAALSGSEARLELQTLLDEAIDEMEKEVSAFRSRMAESKKVRDAARASSQDKEILIRESQFEKAELKRLKVAWNTRIEDIRQKLRETDERIAELKKRRAQMSDRLQDWIFRQYIVHNRNGECSTIAGIFAHQGLVPPGGTGECAAPKLLEYAFRNNLTPLAMGEFWYGRSPLTAVRTHGHFYPSCTSKCGPLLGFMLKGLELSRDDSTVASPAVIYEDKQIVVAEKPFHVPSVPGLDGRVSLQEQLNGICGTDVIPVHRLDMDTSGIMVYAKTKSAEASLKRQFEEHSIRKTYVARLSAPDNSSSFHAGDVPDLRPGQKGLIDLPLSADYDERPRQKADRAQGKASLTEYEVISENPDKTTDILFHPVTGRTHQLRVHSAHTLGLGRPIVGDLLYGGSPSHRLHLHASTLTFVHPSTGEELTFRSSFTV
jgi:tRNA pseudouridine32 synthase/23S rRNA pseudouridine746 synthase